MKKHYLITATTGTGKSTICKKLSEMGYEAYGIEDIPGMFGMYRKDNGKTYDDFDNADPEKIKNADWLCNLEKLKEVISHQQKEIAFYCGIGSNTEQMIPLFDKTFLLLTTKEILHKRLSNREGKDDMGGTETSRQAVLAWKEWWENEMRKLGVIEINAEGTPEEIAQEILKHL